MKICIVSARKGLCTNTHKLHLLSAFSLQDKEFVPTTTENGFNYTWGSQKKEGDFL